MAALTGPITKAQNRMLHALLTKCGMNNDEDKQSLVENITDFRTTHSSQLTAMEAQQAISHLQQLQGEQVKAADKMRKKFFSHAHTLGWHLRDKDNKLLLNNDRPQVEASRIDSFLTEYGPYKKPLQKHSYKELTTALTIFEKAYKL